MDHQDEKPVVKFVYTEDFESRLEKLSEFLGLDKQKVLQGMTMAAIVPGIRAGEEEAGAEYPVTATVRLFTQEEFTVYNSQMFINHLRATGVLDDGWGLKAFPDNNIIMH